MRFFDVRNPVESIVNALLDGRLYLFCTDLLDVHVTDIAKAASR
jgi:hypothetical protein